MFLFPAETDTHALFMYDGSLLGFQHFLTIFVSNVDVEGVLEIIHRCLRTTHKRLVICAFRFLFCLVCLILRGDE